MRAVAFPAILLSTLIALEAAVPMSGDGPPADALAWRGAPDPVLPASPLPRSPLPGTADTTRLAVAGLQAPVTIVTDAWGIPHIYASNEADLFFAQGWNVARDRLFQLELWRRQATGTVAELLGPREVERDRGTRLFRFRGDLRAELGHYHPRGELIVGSFVRGINAYIAETERAPELLPLEFRLLGTRPGRWTPEVVISRHQGLLGNIGAELSTGRAVAAIGADAVASIVSFHPGPPDLRLDPSLMAADLEKDILGVYDAFRTPLAFRPEDIVAAYRGDEAGWRALAAAYPSESELARAGESIGSNNWVVSGALTSNGLPLMANDPHRALAAPSLRYWAHLVAPGWNVIGAGEPALPGVSIGHNEHGAWGLTIFSNDSEDLYVYETNPANPNEYRYAGRWEAMRRVTETIPVRGASPVAVELKYTRHGPVVYEDSALGRAYAVRAAWMDTGGAPYLASLRMNQATNWEEFREACSYSHIPGENMVWADVHGDIGWQAVAVAPIRPNWSGMVPVPGDGRYEWAGYLPIRELPHVLNPAAGFWGNGNDFVVPRDYGRPDALTAGGWADPFRGDRVRELLAGGRRFTIADMMRFQHDELSIPARQLVPLLLELRPTGARTAAALERLRGWDHELDRRSVAAGIYVEFERRLNDNVRALIVPPAARPHIRSISTRRMIDWLLAPDGRFGAAPVAGRNALLLRSLEQAVDTLTQKLGTDMDGWRYGQEGYKHARLRHPLSAAVSPAIRERLEVGSLPRGGYGATVNAAGGGDNQTSGASVRIVAAPGDWDLSVGTQVPGQSGDPDHPRYRDLYELWATHQYFPVLFSRPKVDSAASAVRVLTPVP
jgi:penicillin G amidase